MQRCRYRSVGLAAVLAVVFAAVCAWADSGAGADSREVAGNRDLFEEIDRVLAEEVAESSDGGRRPREPEKPAAAEPPPPAPKARVTPAPVPVAEPPAARPAPRRAARRPPAPRPRAANLPARNLEHGIVYFGADSHTVGPRGRFEIAALGRELWRRPDKKIVLVGSAGEVAGAGADRRLSQRRTAAVKRLLLHELSIAEDRIAIEVSGEPPRLGARRAGGDLDAAMMADHRDPSHSVTMLLF